MATKKSKQATDLLIFTLVAGLLSQSLVIPVISAASLSDHKCPSQNCPDPHADGSPPKGSHHGGSHGGKSSHGTPSHGSSGSHGSSPPNCGTPPSGGHYDPAPPTTGGSPPTDTPSTPSTPTYGSPPDVILSPPTSPSIDPGTPSTPTYGSPPDVILSPPTSPSIDPGTPSTPTYGSPPTYGTPTSPSIDPGTPSTPTYGSTPTTPIDPGTPGSPIFPVTPTIPGISSPPFSFNPTSPLPCTYWLTHPTLIWGLFGFYGTTLGGAFGLQSNNAPGLGPNLSLEQALANTNTDGIGALYREGTASLLNSMAVRRFPFTTNQVRDRFMSALGSNKAATAQARVFKMANEGRLKPRI